MVTSDQRADRTGPGTKNVAGLASPGQADRPFAVADAVAVADRLA